MGTSFLKKLTVLFTVLLCSVLTLALPVVSYAVPSEEGVYISSDNVSDNVSFAFSAGEVSSGDPEAVLQLEKTAFGQLFQNILRQLYPKHFVSPAVPAFYAFSKKDCSLNSILTKGP